MTTPTNSQIAVANFRSFAAANLKSLPKLSPAGEKQAQADGYGEYVTDEARVARSRFCEALATASEEMLATSPEDKHEAEINFVVDMVAELLGFAMAASHPSGFCMGCVQDQVRSFARSLIAAFHYASGDDGEACGHA